MRVLLNRSRTALLQVAGLACIDLAAFNLNTTLGFFSLGVSLFIIEALSGGD
jgi:hypothetical protein